MKLELRKISFVIPCYRSEKTLSGVIDEIRLTVMGKYAYEIILVNDHSPDNVWCLIQKLAADDPYIIGVDLAKNFGQHAALMAGYHYCTGELVVSLDDDGQTPANETLKLIEKIDEGYDVVYAQYKSNMESAFRRFGSRVNSIMAEQMIGKPKGIAIQSFYVAKKYIIEEMLQYKHSFPYLFGLVFRTTQSVANVEVTHRAREIGGTGYTFKKLLALWFNGFTAFSVKPLRIATYIGFIFAAIGFFLGCFFIVNKFVSPDVPLGYSSIISAIMFFGGLNMMVLGLIGEYIGRIYLCINATPQFVVREVTEKQAKLELNSCI